MTTVAALASFDIVYVTTNGGPGDQTTVPGLLVYRLAFPESKVGLAAALAVVLGLLILVDRLPHQPSVEAEHDRS